MKRSPRTPKAPLRIGIFGFKCDPPHLFHLLLAERARVQYNLDIVWFVPAGQPVDKASGVSDKNLRLLLCKKAIAGNRSFKLSTLETDREGPSYMADTLRAFKAMYPENTEFFLIIGEDRAPTIHEWREPEFIVATCTFLVGPRFAGAVEDEWLRKVLPAGSRFGAVKIDNSSTFIRNELANGGSVRYIISDSVAREIRANGMYGAKKPVRKRRQVKPAKPSKRAKRAS